MVYRREIVVVGGSGGDGCVSFRREKYVPLGGPDGGDGGNGGNVIIVADPNLMDLAWMGSKRRFAAGNGHRGGSWGKHGKRGVDLVIPVPVGTLVSTRAKSGDEMVLATMLAPRQRILVGRGGRGGLGNARFATAVNQAPQSAGRGASGQERHIVLEVKPVTDMCIVGPPNSGKSTLLSAISRARPEIADYPFTTRQPVLGVMPGDTRDFIIAEIPALVEGAHLGKGLGNEFLRHAERTKLLIYLLDGSSPTVIDDFKTLDKEVALFQGLIDKPRIVAINKMDLPEAQARLPQMKQHFTKGEVPVFYISARSGQAVLELTKEAVEVVERASSAEETSSQTGVGIFHPKPRR